MKTVRRRIADYNGCYGSKKLPYPLMISLHSARMKCSFSGVRMHREFFWPVLDSPSMTSEHWFILIVPWGSVLGWRITTNRCNKSVKLRSEQMGPQDPSHGVSLHRTKAKRHTACAQAKCSCWGLGYFAAFKMKLLHKLHYMYSFLKTGMDTTMQLWLI